MVEYSSLQLASPTLATVVAVAAGTYLFFWALLRATQDVREPPLVSTSIPFLAPVLGMIRWNMQFYTHMRDKHADLPIYTLRLPGTRLYIVNSTALIPVVQRQWRTLLFPPVTAQATEAAMGVSKEALAIVRKDMVTEEGFLPGFLKAVHPTLVAGPVLDNLSGEAIALITNSLDSMAAKGPTTVKLFEWTRHELLHATTESIYGAQNPMRDPQNQAAWHKYHPAIMFLMLNLLPLWVFKDAIRGREQLVQAFSRYHREGGYKTGSEYIQRWTDHFIKEAIPEPDVARFHIGSMFALVANTIPTTFWMVYRVFSDPTALRECREEVSKSVRERDGVCTVNVRYIKHSCPVLLSTFQEIFRVHGMANSVRVADSDQLLDNKYLIKKGGMIMMPARVQHRMREVWGETVDDFDHHRFVKTPGAKRPNPVAFRGFGGGTTLCPGRHFATTEILVLTAMLLLRFDLVPAGGRWVKPTTENSSQAEAMEQPDHDMDIEFRPREGANKKWRVSFEDNVEAALVAEDLLLS